MSKYFSGNYGSQLGSYDTAAKLIAQAGATQGQMFANLGKQISSTLEKFRINKEKKEGEQRAENQFLNFYEGNPENPIFKNLGINSTDEAKAVAKDISKDPQLIQQAMKFAQFATVQQQAKEASQLNALQRRNVRGQIDDRTASRQGNEQLANFNLNTPQGETPDQFRQRAIQAQGAGNMNPQAMIGASNQFIASRGKEIEARQKRLTELPKNETDLRKEFTALPEIKDFKEVKASYDKVKAAGTNPSAAGDISLIFNYMKILDPGSVVREGEFATAQNAGGVSDVLKNQYNRLIDGQRLNEKQRNDFLNQARLAANAQFNQVRDATEMFRGIIKANNLRENQVIPLKIAELEKDLMEEFKTPSDEQSPKQTMDESANTNRLAATPAGSPTTKPSTNPQFDQLVQQVLQKAAAGENLTPDEQRVIELLEKQKQQNQR